MNDLLTMAVEQKDVSVLADFPPELMEEDDRKVVQYILKFNRKNGTTPSLKTLIETFPTFIPFVWASSKWETEEPPIGQVLEQNIERRLLEMSSQILRDCKAVMNDEGTVPLEMLSEIDALHTLSKGVSRYSSFDRGSYFRRKSMDIPFAVINSHIGGLANGDYMLLVGRLGTGKSTIVQYVTSEIWQNGKKILFISAEMLPMDVFSRIDAMIGGFNPLALRSGKTTEMEGILKGGARTASRGKGEILIPNSRILTPDQIGAFAKNLNVDLIIVDGAYLLRPSTGGFSSKWEKVAAVSNELKQIGLDLQVPLIATAQIKRGASGVEGYDPEDIAFSDALGQDADFVLALFPNIVMKERMELQLIKNRYGSTCASQITTDFETMTISDDSVKTEPITMETWGKSV
jgi:replicative DNA helicase